jgi:hypothetical protein
MTLADELESLFEATEVIINDDPRVALEIRPLPLSGWARVLRWVRSRLGELREQGVTLDNLDEPANMIAVLAMLLETGPDVLAEASGLDVTTVQSLPLDAAIRLLDGVINANKASLARFRESIEKVMGNFTSLARMVETTGSA